MFLIFKLLSFFLVFYLLRFEQVKGFDVLILFECSVTRASVPRLDLDSTFLQKNDIAKAGENEVEKVSFMDSYISMQPLFLFLTRPCLPMVLK